MARILFLAVNPKGTRSVRLDEEIRTIEQRIRLAAMRDLFDVKQEWALQTGDLQRVLLQHKPEIVHFAGLGTVSGEITLEDKSGGSFPVSAKGVGDLFSILKDNVRCVVINACYSRTQARAISEHVDCVIGWPQTVSDPAAICFAAAFYQALGFGRTIKTAFDLAGNQLILEKLDRDVSPVLLSGDHDSALKQGAPSLGGRSSSRRPFNRLRDTSPAVSSGSGPRRRTPKVCDVDLFVSSERFMRGQPSASDSSLATRLSVVLSRLNDGGSNDRGETARQLGYLKDPAAIPILELRWQLELDPTVRYWLAIALGWIGGEGAVKTLKRLKQTEEDKFAQSGINEALNTVIETELV